MRTMSEEAATRRAMQIITKTARKRRLAAAYGQPEHGPIDMTLCAWLVAAEALGRCPPDIAIRRCAAMLLGARKLPADAPLDAIEPQWLMPGDA